MTAQNLFSGPSIPQTHSPSSRFSNPFFGTSSCVNSRSNSPITTTQSPFESGSNQSHGNDSSSISPFNAGSSGQVNYNAGHGLFVTAEAKPEPPVQNVPSPSRQDQMDKAFADLNLLGPKESKPQKSLPMSAMANHTNSANNTFQPIDTASPFGQQIPLQKPSAFSHVDGNNSNNDPFGAPSATVTASTTSQQVRN